MTEELYPGFKFSRASYLFSLFRPSIVRDLDLKRHGLKFYLRDPSSFTPMLDGRYLLMGPDMALNKREIAKFSPRDAEKYEAYEHHMARLTSFIEPFLDAPPPGEGKGMGEYFSQARTLLTAAKSAVKLGRHMVDFHEVLTAPASKILTRWFESEPLKATLATDAVIGAMTSPSTPGSGYVLFHHVMGECEGQRGAWAYVEGGMGAVSQAIAGAAREAGATIHTNASVAQIKINEQNQTTGVVLADGTELFAPTVLVNATPTVTFGKLVERSKVPAEYSSYIDQLDTTSPVTKINVALDRLPNFKCLPNTPDGKPGPQHIGTIHFTETSGQIEEAYRECQRGIPSSRPVIEFTLPSTLDPTLAPPGKHVASLFVQYTPYLPKDGPWTPEKRHAFAQRCFKLIDEYCPGFSESVLYADILTPPDLEAVFGLTGGCIFHHSMSLDSLFWLRPVPGWARHRTPISGLYLCGAGTHPGGGVMGSPGRNAAQIALRDQTKGM